MPTSDGVLRNRSDVLLVAAFSGSGAAALGLELIWLRILGLAFGSETFGMLAVLAAFFAGLAIGSALLHRPVMRHRRPILIYVVAECVIAAYALSGPWFLPRLAYAIPSLLAPHVGDNTSLAALAINIVVGMVILLPATVAMGATTAAGVEAWRRRRSAAENATVVARLYASNTLGATFGILLATYWLMPAAGLKATSSLLATFSLAAAVAAWRWERTTSSQSRGDAESATELPSPEAASRIAGADSRTLVYSLLLLTGLAGVGLETVGTRVLAQIFDNTVYAFANVLAVYLLGTAIGAWLYAQAIDRGVVRNRDRFTGRLLLGLVVTAIAAGAVLARANPMLTWLAPSGVSSLRLLTAQTFVSTLVFLLPTMCMGATFSHLLGHFTESGVGRASALNTFGATLAPFLFGLILIPTAGFGIAFYAAVAIYAVLFVAAQWRLRQPLGSTFIVITLAGAVATATFSPLVIIRLAPGSEILQQLVGIQGVVTVTEASGVNAGGVRRFLQVDQSYFMGGTPGGVERRMGYLAMMTAHEPRDVLYLGLGTGITAGAALDFPVRHITGVDLLHEIVQLLPWFQPYNASLAHDPRVTLHASDARRFVRATQDMYDAVVGDLFHPSRDGVASLYTREHFLAIRARLRPGGIFVQWLPLYQLAPRDFKTIVRTFLDVFPDSGSLLASYSVRSGFALVGHASGSSGDRRGLDVSRAESMLRQTSKNMFEGIPDVLSTFMLTAPGLARFAGTGPINTDDNQRITFDAAPASGIQDSHDFYLSLASVLPFREPFDDRFVSVTGSDLVAIRQNVAPYAQAAAHYLAAEILVASQTTAGPPPKEILDEYVNAYGADDRFASAVRKLVEIALQHPDLARTIVDRLWSAHPERTDVSRLRDDLNMASQPDQVRAALIGFLRGDPR